MNTDETPQLNAEQIAACGFDGQVPIKTGRFDTPTPRTDAALFTFDKTRDTPVWSDFARQLETELAQAKRELAAIGESGVREWLRKCADLSVELGDKERELAAVTKERDEAKAMLVISKKNEAVCHCGEWASAHRMGGCEHSFVPMVEECPNAEPLIKANKDLAALRAELARFDDPMVLHAYCVRHLTQAQVAHLFGERMTEIQNQNDQLRAECERLRADGARLDWLEEQGKPWSMKWVARDSSIGRGFRLHQITEYYPEKLLQPTVRAAIDAAMSAKADKP